MLVRCIIALEQTVMSVFEARFVRAFAWYRLLRHWTAMRWDDTVGIVPSRLRLMARGLAGRLERTKVSGPGKKIVTLPIFVAFDAYVCEPEWLKTGFALWGSDPFSYERDYLLPLPSPDLTGVTKRRAEYSDCVCFSRQLMGSLVSEDGGLLLHPSAVAFWTEHSDRAGIDSWLAALGVTAADRSFLGRWGAKGGADLYARTAYRIVENLQLTAAVHARDLASGGADHFGEEHTRSRSRLQGCPSPTTPSTRRSAASPFPQPRG